EPALTKRGGVPESAESFIKPSAKSTAPRAGVDFESDRVCLDQAVAQPPNPRKVSNFFPINRRTQRKSLMLLATLTGFEPVLPHRKSDRPPPRINTGFLNFKNV